MLGSACLLVGVGTGSFGHRWMDISQSTLVLALKVCTPKLSGHSRTSLRYFPSYFLYMSRHTLSRHVWSSYPSAFFSSASLSNANIPGHSILYSPYYSATASFCYSSLSSSVNRCPHSGPLQEVATELGQSRLPMHIRPFSVHPIGHLSSCLYSLSIILILDFVSNCTLGLF